MMDQKNDSTRFEPVRNLPKGQASPLTVRWLTAARAVWWIVTLIVLVLTVSSIPVLHTFLSTVCPGTECPHQLTVTQIRHLENMGLSISFYATYFTVILTLVPFFYIFVALLLYLRKSAGWIGMLGAYTLVLFGGITFPHTTEFVVTTHPLILGSVRMLDYGGNVLFPLFLLTFPDGRIAPRWSIALVAAWATIRLPSYLFPGSSLDYNIWPMWIQVPIWIFLFGGMLLVQYSRYRKAYNPVLRQQTKWVVYGFIVAWVGHTLAKVAYFLIPKEIQETVPMIFVTNSMIDLMMILIPISIAFAIFHRRLWDIDLLINRTLVYIPLTGILGGLYTATVATFQKIFIATTGTTSDAAIIMTTFVVAATFTPVKNGLQQAVDKRFKESADPLKEINALDTQVRAVVEVLDAGLITRRLLNTSTQALHASGGAVYLEQGGQMVLAQATPGWNDENRIVSLPLEWNGRRIGLLSLGAREGGAEYSVKECQVLQQAANQVARVVTGFGIDTSE